MPPVGLLESVEAVIDADRAERPLRAQRRPWRSVWFLAIASGAVASSAAAALLVFAFLTVPDVPSAARLHQADGQLALDGFEPGASLILEIRHESRYASEGRAFEVWLITQSGSTPISLGLLTRKGEVTLLPLSDRLEAGDIIAISEEASGGSSTAVPSGPVLTSMTIQTGVQ